MITKEALGRELEEAHANVLSAVIVGGFRDCGKDLVVPGIGFVQVKPGLERAYAFLAKSIERCRFIPICIGEPGSAEEMLKDLKKFGVWVGKEIKNRLAVQVAVAEIRKTILAKSAKS